MDMQQIIILGTTILGWGILAGSLIFAIVIFAKLYMGRDKEAAEAKKKDEQAAKAALKAEKENKGKKTASSRQKKDALPGARLQSTAQAPKREEIVSRLAETTRKPEETVVPDSSPFDLGKSSIKSFLDDDDIDEFDFAKKKATRSSTSSEAPTESAKKGFPPPPRRLS